VLQKNTKLECEPSRAAERQALDDNTWEFKRRKGEKFHNGDSF